MAPGGPSFSHIQRKPKKLGFSPIIELKAEGRRLSQAQIQFRATAEGLGAKYAVCHSIDEVKDVLETWGVTFLGRAA